MQVSRKDGRCRSCGGTLTIIDAADATLRVECQNPECGEFYDVETDAFGDGGVFYYPAMLSKMMEGGRE